MSTAGKNIPWSLAIIAGGALAGALLLWSIAAGNDADTTWPAALFGGLAGLFVAGTLVAGWQGSRPFRLRRSVPIAADAIHDHAERWFGRAPWVLARNDPTELVYWRRTEPVMGTVVLLLILGVIPGILYYFWARGTQTIAIGVVPAPGGADLEILVHPQRSDGRNRAVDFFNSLHGLIGPSRTP